MASLEQIQQDIQALPQEALNVLYQFIQLLKNLNSAPAENSPAAAPSASAEVTDWSDFIGCISAEEDLSVNYKTYLAEELEQKHDHR